MAVALVACSGLADCLERSLFFLTCTGSISIAHYCTTLQAACNPSLHHAIACIWDRSRHENVKSSLLPLRVRPSRPLHTTTMMMMMIMVAFFTSKND